MSVPFSGIITPQSIAFNGPDGKMYNVSDAHVHYSEMKAVIKELQQALKDGNDVQPLHQKLVELAEPAKQIIVRSDGKVMVENGVVIYNGEAVHNAITERIVWGIKEGFDMKPYMLFLEHLMENPSKRAVDELYRFLEKHKMGIMDDGSIIAYKKVREDYTDIHSGKFDNSPGQVLEMPRNHVDDDANRTCSTGFHFCAFDYLPSFGSGPGNRIVIVKVNPRDVVSIPADHNDAKARCCRYEVIGEYDGPDKENILAQKAIWTDSDWTNEDDESDWSREDENDEFYEDYNDDDDDDEQDDSDEFDAEGWDGGARVMTASERDDMEQLTRGMHAEVASALAAQGTPSMLDTKPNDVIREVVYIGGGTDRFSVIIVHFEDGTTFHLDAAEQDRVAVRLSAQAAKGNKAIIRLR